MGKKLILAEKPSLAKTIALALDKNIKKKGPFYENDSVIVANLVGHVLKLKIPRVPWDMDNLPYDYDNLEHIPIDDKKKLVADLVKSMEREDIDEIVSAGDPDTEGSLLVQELIDYAEIPKKRSHLKLTRMWILSYDISAIKSSFDERFDLEKDKPWSEAASVRGYSDLYVGYNLSPFFSLLKNKKFSIGRVKTPTLALIRNRELEIDRFEPVQYFLVTGDFSKNNLPFTTKYLCSENNNTEKIPTEHIEKVKGEKLANTKFKVSENQTKPKKTNPDYLPNLNDVLKAMSKKYKMKAKKVTDDMQFLYENQFCSYPRSEQKFLPPDMENVFEDIFNNYNKTPDFEPFEASFDVSNKRIFDKDKSNPHYAITPLSKSASAIEGLSPSQRKVFDFILGQYMMAFMPAYEYDETVILLENGDGAKFKISGKAEKIKGFKAYQASISKQSKKKKEEAVLPVVAVGDELDLLKYKTEEKWTEPPKLLTEGELLGYMENIHKIYIAEKEDEEEEVETDEEIFKEKFSLGTPATRGPIVTQMFDNEIILLNKDNRVETTMLGKETYDAVNPFVSIDMTAEFEQRMNKIKFGEEKASDFLSDIKNTINDIIKNNKAGYVPKAKAEKAGKDCPSCGKELLKRKMKDGKEFLNCSGYPDCKYVEWPQDKAGRDCPKCSSDLINRTTKDGKKFIACSGYPDCKYVEWPQDKTGKQCPKCSSDLINRTTKDGKKFVSCSGYPDCKYVEWPQDKTGEKCPKCEEDLIWRKKKDGGKFTSCSGYPKCDYVDWG
jgi:DNA topoisomerase-3